MTQLNSATYKIAKNGRHHVMVSQNGKNNMTITAEWKTPGIPVAGTLIFSVQGDPGINNVKDLSTGLRVWMTNGRPPFFDVDVLDLPVGAELLLHVW